MTALLDSLKGKLIVSCQAYPGEPMLDPRTMSRVALSAVIGGFPEVLVMADCGSADDAVAAQDAGCDIIGTTLVGYSGERPKTPGPDWEAVDQMVAVVHRPLFVEGRVHTVDDAAEALRRGAHAVVVGTAITHPASITGWFVDALAAG